MQFKLLLETTWCYGFWFRNFNSVHCSVYIFSFRAVYIYKCIQCASSTRHHKTSINQIVFFFFIFLGKIIILARKRITNCSCLRIFVLFCVLLLEKCNVGIMSLFDLHRRYLFFHVCCCCKKEEKYVVTNSKRKVTKHEWKQEI